MLQFVTNIYTQCKEGSEQFTLVQVMKDILWTQIIEFIQGCTHLLSYLFYRYEWNIFLGFYENILPSFHESY